MALNWEDSGLLASGSEPGRQLIVRRRWLYKLVLKKMKRRRKRRKKGRRERRRKREKGRERGWDLYSSVHTLKRDLFLYSILISSPSHLDVFMLMFFTWLLDCSLLEDRNIASQLCISQSAWRTLVLKNLAVKCMNKRMNFCIWSISSERSP